MFSLISDLTENFFEQRFHGHPLFFYPASAGDFKNFVGL